MAGMGRGPLRIAFEDFLATFGIGKKLEAYASIKSENFEKRILHEFPELFALLDQNKELKKYIDFSKVLREPGHQGELLSLAGFATQLGSGVSSSLLGPAFKLMNYGMEQSMFHTARLDPATATRLNWRDGQYQVLLDGDTAQQGWTPERLQALAKSMRPRLQGADLTTLWLRQYITDSQFMQFMEQFGWLPEDLLWIKELSNQIPGPGDLISMAVREAWNEEVVARFQYDKDLPPEFVSWMKKQGYTEDWSKRFWRQHWTLPGVAQGYEMVHRLRPGVSANPFTMADMELLLKTADVPEFFRKRLIDISYNPYTRVDVRRLFGTGILTEAQVKSNYLDLGYDEEHAANLTRFTTQGARAEEKGLTPSVITGLYHDAILSRAEAKTQLVDLGYTDDNAEYLLLIVDVELDRVDTASILSNLHQRYVEGLLDRPTLAGLIGQLNLPSDRVERMLQSWEIDKDNHVKAPSVGDLETWYKSNLVRRPDYLAGLARSGFNQADSLLYVRQTDLEIAADARKAAAAAVAAAAAALASARATAAQRALANLDVNITDDQLDIATYKVALHGDITPVEQQTILDAIDAATLEIAQYRLDAARIVLGAI